MRARVQAARLLAADKSIGGTRLVLLGRGDITIGHAAGSQLSIAHEDVAARHALLSYATGRYFLADLGSAGGTYVNGSRLRRARALRHRDQIRFGPVSYKFIDPDGGSRRRDRILANAILAIVIVGMTAWFAHVEGWDAGILNHAPVAASQLSNGVAALAPHAAASSAVATAVPKALTAAVSAPKTVSVAHEARIAPAAAAPIKAPGAPKLSASANSRTAFAQIDRYRTLAGLPPLANVPEVSAAAASHANYLLVNFSERIRAAEAIGDSAHEENPHLGGYSSAGAQIAPNSQLGWGCNANDINRQIDNWIGGPFHRFDLLDPNVSRAGFGEATRDGCWAAALRIEPAVDPLKAYAHAVEFPPDGSTIALEWIGIESPDPLGSCPGYERPVGLPITLQLGRLADTRITKESLTENGHAIEHCAYDSHGYRNPMTSEQEWGRWALRNAGGVIIIPRAPLVAGALYAVSITTRNTTYNWSFHTSATYAADRSAQ